MSANAAKIFPNEEPAINIPSTSIDSATKGPQVAICDGKSADALRTIGEAADILQLKTHVLRFWETKFSQIKPVKRRDGRRFYDPNTLRTLAAIRQLLHVQGMSIKGAQRYLEAHGVDAVDVNSDVVSAPTPVAAGQSVRDLQDTVRRAVEDGAFKSAVTDDSTSKDKLSQLLSDLTNLKDRVDQVRKVG